MCCVWSSFSETEEDTVMAVQTCAFIITHKEFGPNFRHIKISLFTGYNHNDNDREELFDILHPDYTLQWNAI